jgi:UDP-glucose-4-epimerase GalE
MKLLVTGGAGYVGAHSCKYFSEKGHEIIVLDNLSRGHKEFVQWGELIEGDLCELKSCEQALIDAGPFDGVLHCAAYIYVGEAEQYPELYMRNNVGGTLALLKFIKKQKIPQIVFSSSCTIYGEKVKPPFTVDTPIKPFSVYGHTKAICEKAIQEMSKATGLKYGLVRYFNASGNDVSGKIYERHEPEFHLLPNIYRAIKTNSPLNVNGDDYPTPDKTCIRDYVHVNDIARAHAYAFDAMENQPSVILNVGSGKGYSILEVVKQFEKVMGQKVQLKFGKRRPGDIPAIYSDTSSGFKTSYDLEKIIESTVVGFDKAGFIPDSGDESN